MSNALSVGKYLYVYDLSTVSAARRHGHATALLTWIIAEAKRLGSMPGWLTRGGYFLVMTGRGRGVRLSSRRC